MREDFQYKSIIDRALTEFGVTPTDVLCGLLELLPKHHRETIGLHRIGTFQDGFDGVTGKTAVSLADSLRNFAIAVAGQLEILRLTREGASSESSAYEREKVQIECLARIIDRALPDWDRDALQFRSTTRPKVT